MSVFSYLALGKPKEALSMILRRSDPHALRVAASVAKETKDTDAMLAYAWSYVAELMLACDWPSAEEFLATLPAVEVGDYSFGRSPFQVSHLSDNDNNNIDNDNNNSNDINNNNSNIKLIDIIDRELI